MRHDTLLTSLTTVVRNARDHVTTAVAGHIAPLKAEVSAQRHDLAKLTDEVAGLADATRAVLAHARKPEPAAAGEPATVTVTKAAPAAAKTAAGKAKADPNT